MTANDLERLERERLDRDRQYNDALTALDHALNAAASQTAVDRGDLERLATALLVFLQQITGFVDSKDRELVARAADRVEKLEPALASIDELRAQVATLQRAMQMLTRETSDSRQSSVARAPSSVAGPQPAVASHGDDYKYVGFEDQFRGSDEAIAAKLQAYLPIFTGASDVVDLGCGRGEFLAALSAAGVRARGVDTNSEMVATAAARGLDVSHSDALTYLSSVPDESLGGIIATQVVEHLEPSYLMRLLDTASHKLRAGAPIVIETINAACWLAFFSSYIRDITHVRPVHPETLQYLLRASGFTHVTIQYSAPVPDAVKMKTANLPADVLAATDSTSRALHEIAHAVNANGAILNNLMFTHLDYAAIGYRS